MMAGAASSKGVHQGLAEVLLSSGDKDVCNCKGIWFLVWCYKSLFGKSCGAMDYAARVRPH
jgi:hypothetical protein